VTVAVVQFGGSNCDRDTVRALAHLGFDAELVWHEDGLPADTTGVVLPGGFSYGDYLRAGAMAARSPVMEEVREAVADGTPVLGVCNGAQIGCEGGLTPGTFTTNRSARFQCERVHVNASTSASRTPTPGSHATTRRATFSNSPSLTARAASRSTPRHWSPSVPRTACSSGTATPTAR